MRLKILFFSSVLALFLSFTAEAHAGEKPSVLNRAELAVKASKNGHVRIIAGFRSDSYPELIKASQTAARSSKTAAGKRAAEKADLAVKAETDRSRKNALAQLDSKNYIVRRAYKYTPQAAMEVTSEGLSALLNNPLVEYIAEDTPRKLPDTLTSPYAGEDSIGAIGADDAWAAGYTGDGWYVAVIDTGIRRTHEMFAGKNIEEACFSDNDCPDGSSEMIGAGSAAHYESSYKAYDHGTHVAGIAAGNSAVQKGVAKDADIIAIQVFSRFENNSLCGGTAPFYDDCVLSYTSDQMAALDYIYDTLKNTHSIAAINMSLGGGQESGYCDNDDLTYTNYINVLTGAGIAVAIATGNESYCGYISSPACIEKALAVGAVTVLDVEASFSNYQINLVDIFAPGVTINSAVGSGDTDYAAWNGTSMATPHVAGAFAVFREKNTTLTVDQLETVMKNTRSAVTYGCAPHGTEGRINVDSVINSIADSVDMTVPYNVTVNINNGSVFTNSRSVTVSISGSDGTGIDGYYVSESGTTPDAADFSPVSSTLSLDLNLTFSLTGADGTKTVYAWLKDGSGNISAAASDSITLDTTAPYVVSVSPSNNSADVAVTTNISVQFSESILSSTLSSAHLSLVNQSTMTPVTEGGLSISGNNVTFNPAADLSSGTAYTVNVTDGIRDQAGNQLSPEFQSFFVTLAAQGGDDNETDDNQTDGGEDNETDDGDDNESENPAAGGGSGGGGCSAGAGADYALVMLMLVSGIILMRRKA